MVGADECLEKIHYYQGENGEVKGIFRKVIKDNRSHEKGCDKKETERIECNKQVFFVHTPFPMRQS
jgi:hypothetical protein